MRRDAKNRKLLRGEIQKKDGSYQYSFKDAGGKRRYIRSWRLTPTDPVPAEKAYSKSLRELEQEIQADMINGVSSSKAGSLDSQFERFLSMKDEVRDTTKNKYRELYNRYIKEVFGTQDVQKIKYSDIKMFYVYLKKEKKLSGGTIRKINCVLNQCLDMVVKDNLIRKNPCDGVIKELGSTGNLKPKKKTGLTRSQQKEMLEFVSNSIYSFWLNLIVFLLGTGCRIGEAAGLRWKDVDFSKNVIHIRNSLVTTGKGYEHILQKPKTDAGIRDIPMLAEVREALLNQRQRYPDYNMDGYVFLNKVNTELDRNRFNQVLKRIVRDYNAANQENGLSLPEDLSAHTLRHCFGTRMCENGVNVKVTQALMGHAKVSTTLDIYTDVFDDTIYNSVLELEGKMPLGRV